jgi:hopanoid biosynthesis associated RND transporter like protein HpnN
MLRPSIARLVGMCKDALGVGGEKRSRSPLVAVVDWCAGHAWLVIALAVALTGVSGVYAARQFAIKTDINDLFPPDLPWIARAFAYMNAFPPRDILVVVEAPTPEFADAAAAKLGHALAADQEHFRAVEQTQGGPFFAQNGWLFMPTDEVARIAGDLEKTAPLLGLLSADPSLRGALDALSYGVMGVANGIYSLDALAGPMSLAAETVGDALAGRPAHFSWRALTAGKPSEPSQLRRYIQIAPVVDFSALEPGRAAIDAIDQTARRLNLAGDYQARVRTTGLVAINGDQFATLTEHAALNATATIAAVILILWLALRSWQIILAALISVFCGLAMSAALGLYLVGALNLMSVAFFVLFVGLGVDFGIQFAVRYRAERHEVDALRPALVGAATKAGGPLALAAVATALGFSAFLPTSYRGLAELGEIAGPGMIIAFITSITLLPALLVVLKPPSEPRPMGFAALAPVDRFLERFRVPVVAITLLGVVLASPLLLFLPFDFDPVHMSNPRTEAVATFLKLRNDPQTGANAIEIMAPDANAADATARELSALPQVWRATTLASFVPADQDRKLAQIRQLAAALRRELSPAQTKPPPTDRQDIEALLSTAISLGQFAAIGTGPGADAANRLFGLLVRLASADPATRQRVAAAVIEPLQISLSGLRGALNAQPVTVATLPPDLKRAWLAPDGRARVQVLPKGDPNDAAVLREFVKVVTAAAPEATGPAVQLYEAGNTVVRALIEAGIFAMAGIFLLLWITLRRISDVLLTLVPLLLATVVTLELCVVFGLPLNFANIIALPLLLGVGVAFKIYYIMAWRRGRTALVQSVLSRAVIFSAMTTATAFGSLWLSSHPGTSSMGKLMALALVSTMAAAVFFQPALMGPPRAAAKDPAADEPEPKPEAAALPLPARVPEPAGWVVGPREPGRPAGGARQPAETEDRREEQTVSHDRDR